MPRDSLADPVELQLDFRVCVQDRGTHTCPKVQCRTAEVLHYAASLRSCPQQEVATMSSPLLKEVPARPKALVETPVPPLPEVDESKSDVASVQYSHYRTKLSRHRTGLSEHRTSLSEYRTNLSMHRTDLSTERTEMSMRRTGMSFQRTRMSADRTLMSVMRTSLSLIGFGFTLFQFFEKLKEAGTLTHAGAPRNFGISLVLLGIAMLVLGIA